MDYKRKSYRIALGGLFLGLVAATLGCHGPGSRYGLLLGDDLSAELWKFPAKNGSETVCHENVQAPGMESTCSEETGTPAYTEMPCPEVACPRRPLLAWGARATEESVEPPPMIAPRFFPVPTRPVFTPRGDLSNLNPCIQRTLPATNAELFEYDPETTLPELMPKGPVVPGPAPESSTTAVPYHNEYRPDLQRTQQPISSQHWAFSDAPTNPKTDREKAFDLIATGSEIVQ